MSWGAIKLRLRESDQTIFDGEASPAPGGGSMPLLMAAIQHQTDNGLGLSAFDEFPLLDDLEGYGGMSALSTSAMLLHAGDSIWPGVDAPTYSAGALTLGSCVFALTNAAGTQMIFLNLNSQPVIPSFTEWNPSSAGDWTIFAQVGADLSVTSQGRVKSTAGGLFIASTNVIITTPYPTP